MPKIEQYTRQIAPTQTNSVRAGAESFGGDTTGQQMQARALQQTGNALQDAGNVIADVVQKRNNRIDTVNSVRATNKFYDEMYQEYNRVLAEEDIVDEETTARFNENVRSKASALLAEFKGSPEAKARLEVDILNQASTFTRKMTQTNISAQRNVVFDAAGSQIKSLAGQVRQSPEKFNEIMMQAEGVIDKLAGGLYADDETTLRTVARSQVSLTALNTFIDSGMFEEADAFITANPAILESIDPDTQRRVLKDIDAGIKERTKEIDEVKTKIAVVKSAAKELGVDVSGAELFQAATGISQAQTPAAKIAEFEKLTGTPATPSAIAKIGFGVDLGDTAGLSEYAKITAERIKKPYEAAAAANIMLEKVTLQADEFLTNGNNQAGLAAMISFNKMIDDGTAVREGDLQISAQGNSAFDNLKLMIDKVGKGGIATPEQIMQMTESAKIFAKSVTDASKTYIDPYLLDAQSQGLTPLRVGLPIESYKRVFGTDQFDGVKADAPAPAGLDALSDDELQEMLNKLEGAKE